MATNIIARPGRTIIALGPYCWGKGKDSRTALRKARQNLPRFCRQRTYEVTLVDAPADAYVNNMGRVCWDDVTAAPATQAGTSVFHVRL